MEIMDKVTMDGVLIKMIDSETIGITMAVMAEIVGVNKIEIKIIEEILGEIQMPSKMTHGVKIHPKVIMVETNLVLEEEMILGDKITAQGVIILVGEILLIITTPTEIMPGVPEITTIIMQEKVTGAVVIEATLDKKMAALGIIEIKAQVLEDGAIKIIRTLQIDLEVTIKEISVQMEMLAILRDALCVEKK
jgi:hypothetical protein